MLISGCTVNGYRFDPYVAGIILYYFGALEFLWVTKIELIKFECNKYGSSLLSIDINFYFICKTRIEENLKSNL